MSNGVRSTKIFFSYDAKTLYLIILDRLYYSFYHVYTAWIDNNGDK